MNKQNKAGWGGFIFIILLVMVGSGVNFTQLFNRGETDQPSTEQVYTQPDVNQKDYTQYATDELSSQEIVSDEPESEEPIIEEPIIEEQVSDSSNITETQQEGYPADLHDLSAYVEFKGSPVIELSGAGIHVGETVSADFWPLDGYGRPTGARATLSQNMMRSSEGRPGITIDPPGFKNKQYVNANAKKYWLYNRSHLIAYTLFNGDTEVKENLVTGTQQMNQVYMTQYEDEVRLALRNGELVEYQVEPMYREAELVPRALALRMRSSLDTLNKTVIIYNVQDGVTIDYLTGDSQGPTDGIAQTTTQTNTSPPSQDNLNNFSDTSISYKNCDAVRAAGAAPIYRGEPGYSKKLDRDGDGIGCE